MKPLNKILNNSLFKWMILFVFIICASFLSIKKIYKEIFKHELKELKSIAIDGEQGFVDVNKWLSLNKGASVKGVIKHTKNLPPLKKSFFHKIKTPPPWMVENIQEDFSPFKALDQKAFKYQPSFILKWVQDHKQERFSSYCQFVKNYRKEIPLKNQGKEAESFVHYRLEYNKDNPHSYDLTSQALGYLMLVKYKIREGKLYVNYHSLKAQRVKPMNVIFNHLAQALLLPDMEFFVSLHDWCEIDTLGVPIEKNVPIFTFSKIKNYTLPVLIPDPEMLLGYKEIDAILDKSEKDMPWEDKIQKAFWRGATSSGCFDLPDWRLFPRTRLVYESLKWPSETDARFSKLIQGASHNAEFMSNPELCGNVVSIKDSQKYKYLIDVDGNACTYSRFYWILKSQSVPFKHQASFIQWYYKALKPYEHYVPIKEDFSDLSSQVDWARLHDNEVKKIAEKSSDFAKKQLTTEDAYVYLYLCLIKYQSLFDNK